MNIEFVTQDVNLKEESSKEITQYFASPVKSVEVCLKGFTLNYHHEHDHDGGHEEEAEAHVACVELDVPNINGTEVSCRVSTRTPEDAIIDERNAKVLFIATF